MACCRNGTFLVERGHTDLDLPFTACELPIIQQLIRGIKRYHGERDRKPKPPITLNILGDLLRQLRPDTRPGHLDIYAACCLAYSGLLRCGEFTTNKKGPFDPTTQPSRNAIKFVPSNAEPAHAILTLPASKTDPFCKGISIHIAGALG